MKDYNQFLKEQFSELEINIVKHDTSPTGLPTYLEIHLGKMPKDKGQIALNASNYLSRLGLVFQSMPEYRGKGKSTTLRFFQTWEHLHPHVGMINKKFGLNITNDRHLANEFRSLIIQNPKRGVYANL